MRVVPRVAQVLAQPSAEYESQETAVDYAEVARWAHWLAAADGPTGQSPHLDGFRASSVHQQLAPRARRLLVFAYGQAVRAQAGTRG